MILLDRDMKSLLLDADNNDDADADACRTQRRVPMAALIHANVYNWNASSSNSTPPTNRHLDRSIPFTILRTSLIRPPGPHAVTHIPLGAVFFCRL